MQCGLGRVESLDTTSMTLEVDTDIVEDAEVSPLSNLLSHQEVLTRIDVMRG